MKLRKVKSKDGSISIFLAVIITSLLAITLSLVYAFHERSIESCSDGIFRLAGDSVLSEYNYYVQQEYGLFLIDQTDKQLSSKFRNYASYSLKTFKDADFSAGSVTSDRFSVADTSAVYSQMLRYMKTTGIIDSILETIKNSSKENDMKKRTLRHGPTIDSLPSALVPDKNLLTTVEQLSGKLSNPEAALESGTEKYLISSYILGTFNHDTSALNSSHFFRNEVEYIISGALSDEKNVKKVDLAIEALRTPSNLAHIYSDPEKVSIVEAASQTLTPGILGTVTQAGIALAWATAESVNDARLLHKGYKVPFVKDATSWAIDFDGLIKGIEEGDVFKPDVNKGQDYSDYLRLLLFIKDDDVKTARILDLIQINMRKDFDGDFLIQGCSTGIEFSGSVNGKGYQYDKVY